MHAEPISNRSFDVSRPEMRAATSWPPSSHLRNFSAYSWSADVQDITLFMRVVSKRSRSVEAMEMMLPPTLASKVLCDHEAKESSVFSTRTAPPSPSSLAIFLENVEL